MRLLSGDVRLSERQEEPAERQAWREGPGMRRRLRARMTAVLLSAESDSYLLVGKKNEIRSVLKNPPTQSPPPAQGHGRPPPGNPGQEDKAFLVPQHARGSGSADRYGGEQRGCVGVLISKGTATCHLSVRRTSHREWSGLPAPTCPDQGVSGATWRQRGPPSLEHPNPGTQRGRPLDGGGTESPGLSSFQVNRPGKTSNCRRAKYTLPAGVKRAPPMGAWPLLGTGHDCPAMAGERHH